MEAVCVLCSEGIIDGDDVRLMPAVIEGECLLAPVHQECFLLSMVGHEHDLCPCTKYGGHSRRTAGLLLAMELRERGEA